MPRWILDSLEEDSAQIEEDGTRVIHVPRSILPESAKEGDVLIVTTESDGRDGMQVRISIDRGATRAAKFRSSQQMRRIKGSGKGDPGGDVVL